VTKTVLQAALDAEMADHLGYEKGERPPLPAGNHRNGTSPKTVLTEVGPIPLQVPRDRNGKFDPQIVPKHARRVAGFNEGIVSLYAEGLRPGRSAITWARSTAWKSPATWSPGSPIPSLRNWRRGSPGRSIACIRCC
jgi:transposase-like protein